MLMRRAKAYSSSCSQTVSLSPAISSPFIPWVCAAAEDWIYGKALLFLKLVFQAADGEDLVILTCTAFDWSTRATDRQTDGRTKLRWMRCAKAIAAFARWNFNCILENIAAVSSLLSKFYRKKLSIYLSVMLQNRYRYFNCRRTSVSLFYGSLCNIYTTCHEI